VYISAGHAGPAHASLSSSVALNQLYRWPAQDPCDALMLLSPTLVAVHSLMHHLHCPTVLLAALLVSANSLACT
jgi:hypothetical protein